MANAKINFEDEQVRKIYRHTTSHILAQAVKRIWPDVKLAIGPAIDNGYYYDFDMEHKITEEEVYISLLPVCKVFPPARPFSQTNINTTINGIPPPPFRRLFSRLSCSSQCPRAATDASSAPRESLQEGFCS